MVSPGSDLTASSFLRSPDPSGTFLTTSGVKATHSRQACSKLELPPETEPVLGFRSVPARGRLRSPAQFTYSALPPETSADGHKASLRLELWTSIRRPRGGIADGRILCCMSGTSVVPPVEPRYAAARPWLQTGGHETSCLPTAVHLEVERMKIGDRGRPRIDPEYLLEDCYMNKDRTRAHFGGLPPSPIQRY